MSDPITACNLLYFRSDFATLTVYPRTTRPARITRYPFTDGSALPTEFLTCDDHQFGDILLFRRYEGDDVSTQRYRVYIYFDSANPARLRALNHCLFTPFKNDYVSLNKQLKIPLRITNVFADAVQHYSEVIDAECKRSKEGLTYFDLKLVLHPVDRGFRARFCEQNEWTAAVPNFDSASVTAISRRWKSVTVLFVNHGSQHHAVKSNFGNGTVYSALEDENIALDKLVPGDLSVLTAAYWRSLKTTYRCFVVLYRPIGSDSNFAGALKKTLPPEWKFYHAFSYGQLNQHAKVSLIYGPVATFDRAAFTRRVAAFCANETKSQFFTTKLKKIILETDSLPLLNQGTSRELSYRRLEKASLTFSSPPQITWRDHQWIGTHALISDVMIGMASLDMAPYVMLEILDWLSPCYHARHVQKINLIMALRKSIQRVLQSHATRYGRTIRRVYDNKWQKIAEK